MLATPRRLPSACRYSRQTSSDCLGPRSMATTFKNMMSYTRRRGITPGSFHHSIRCSQPHCKTVLQCGSEHFRWGGVGDNLLCIEYVQIPRVSMDDNFQGQSQNSYFVSTPPLIIMQSILAGRRCRCNAVVACRRASPRTSSSKLSLSYRRRGHPRAGR